MDAHAPTQQTTLARLQLVVHWIVDYERSFWGWLALEPVGFSLVQFYGEGCAELKVLRFLA